MIKLPPRSPIPASSSFNTLHSLDVSRASTPTLVGSRSPSPSPLLIPSLSPVSPVPRRSHRLLNSATATVNSSLQKEIIRKPLSIPKMLALKLHIFKYQISALNLRRSRNLSRMFASTMLIHKSCLLPHPLDPDPVCARGASTKSSNKTAVQPSPTEPGTLKSNAMTANIILSLSSLSACDAAFQASAFKIADFLFCKISLQDLGSAQMWTTFQNVSNVAGFISQRREHDAVSNFTRYYTYLSFATKCFM